MKYGMIHINEIFDSISGEVGMIPQGGMAMFIRTQGCNLSCDYCDAETSQFFASDKDTIIMAPEILAKAILVNPYPVLLTGGEPMLQFSELYKALSMVKMRAPRKIIQIETNGTIPYVFRGDGNFKRIPADCIVMDYKLHSPPTEDNLGYLRSEDFLKIVVSDKREFETVGYMIRFYRKLDCTIAVSATDVGLYPELIEVVKSNNNRAIVNVQIHKIIGVE